MKRLLLLAVLCVPIMLGCQHDDSIRGPGTITQMKAVRIDDTLVEYSVTLTFKSARGVVSTVEVQITPQLWKTLSIDDKFDANSYTVPVPPTPEKTPEGSSQKTP